MDDMALWEIAAFVDGHNRANAPADVAPPTNAEFDDMLERHNVIDIATRRKA